jgi:hypothetical protein
MTESFTTQEKCRTQQREAGEKRKYKSWEEVEVAVVYFVVLSLYSLEVICDYIQLCPKYSQRIEASSPEIKVTRIPA